MRGNKKRSWTFLLAEFFVVFISVSGAFYLDTVKEDRQLRENQIKYYETFLLNLEVGAYKIEILNNSISAILEKHQANSEEPITIDRNLSFMNNQLVIRSGFEEQNFSVITPQYLRNLDEGSNLITRVQNRLANLEARTQEYLFYTNVDKAAFKEWYLDELVGITQVLAALDQAVNEGAIPATKQFLEELK